MTENIPAPKVKKRIATTLISTPTSQNIPPTIPASVPRNDNMSDGQKRTLKLLENLEKKVQDKSYGKYSGFSDFNTKTGKKYKKNLRKLKVKKTLVRSYTLVR